MHLKLLVLSKKTSYLKAKVSLVSENMQSNVCSFDRVTNASTAMSEPVSSELLLFVFITALILTRLQTKPAQFYR